MKLHKIYHPITATPFKYTKDYMEIEPCDALKPYIRCFWGSREVVMRKENHTAAKSVVTPDTCMDIIFSVDFTNNRIDSNFCGIDDRTFITCNDDKEKKTSFLFAIRFYAWGAALFAEESMKNTKNSFFDVGCHFTKIKAELEQQLFDITDIYQLIPIAEKILLKHFHEKYKNQIIFQAVLKILENKGNLLITDLKQEVLVSSRQLERLFLEYIGISPKGLASIVRYQYLWNELLYNKNFNIADAVYRYGYSDQAHLCHDFKKYHSMSMVDAKKHALQNVGNIQDTSSDLSYNAFNI